MPLYRHYSSLKVALVDRTSRWTWQRPGRPAEIVPTLPARLTREVIIDIVRRMTQIQAEKSRLAAVAALRLCAAGNVTDLDRLGTAQWHYDAQVAAAIVGHRFATTKYAEIASAKEDYDAYPGTTRASLDGLGAIRTANADQDVVRARQSLLNKPRSRKYRIGELLF